MATSPSICSRSIGTQRPPPPPAQVAVLLGPPLRQLGVHEFWPQRAAGKQATGRHRAPLRTRTEPACGTLDTTTTACRCYRVVLDC
eukprot:12813748-Alexandrium_andersonii.AAC.1